VFTGQLQVERRAGKVCRPKIDVLPLCHATSGRQCVQWNVSVCRSGSSTDESSQHLPGADTTAYHEYPSKLFTWAGPTVHRLTLAPGSSHEICQTACFAGSGVYNLNVLRVSAGSTTDIVMVPQRSTSAAPIIIHNTPPHNTVADWLP